MADSFTQNLKARKVEQGGYDGNWANELNDECVELLDDAIAGTSAINLGVATTYSLAALGNGLDSESRAFRLHFTGTPASAVTVTVPATVTGKPYLVHNACGQTLTIKYAATSGVAVLNGEMVLVWCDGATVHLIVIAGQITSYTPTWTSAGTAPAIGNGTLSGRYMRNGRGVKGHAEVAMGSTTTFGTGEYRLSLPLPAASGVGEQPTGIIYMLDNGTAHYVGVARIPDAGTFVLGSPNGLALNIGPTSPFTFASGDVIRMGFDYMAA